MSSIEIPAANILKALEKIKEILTEESEGLWFSSYIEYLIWRKNTWLFWYPEFENIEDYKKWRRKKYRSNPDNRTLSNISKRIDLELLASYSMEYGDGFILLDSEDLYMLNSLSNQYLLKAENYK